MHSVYRLVIFNVLSRLKNIREQQKSLGLRPRDFYCSLVFVTPGKALELVYEILLERQKSM